MPREEVVSACVGCGCDFDPVAQAAAVTMTTGVVPSVIVVQMTPMVGKEGLDMVGYICSFGCAAEALRAVADKIDDIERQRLNLSKGSA